MELSNSPIQRIYDEVVARHLARYPQMVFVSGPRQVGKTTTCRRRAAFRFNWDEPEDRARILAGPASFLSDFGLVGNFRPTILFDELHKFSRWKSFLKGFFDTYGHRYGVVVCGSARMDVWSRVGDSLMGRYFRYRMHPFSVAELITTELPDRGTIVRPQRPIDSDAFGALWLHGGWPDPFVERDPDFGGRWRLLRENQLVREDIRDMTAVQHIDQLELLVRMLAGNSGGQLRYSRLAKQVRVSEDTIRRWIASIESLQHGFRIRPWFENVPRSLRKEPKWFARDWSGLTDPGDRAETFVACHLLKAVEGWTDLGFGRFGLNYLRDRDDREVDFLVTRDQKPWFLVEAKHGKRGLSPHLQRFQEQTEAPFAFQVRMNRKFEDADCFARPGGEPMIVPARTLLSQLL